MKYSLKSEYWNIQLWWVVVMSPSQVGLWSFSLQLGIENWPKTSWNFDSQLKTYSYSLFFYDKLVLKMNKLSNQIIALNSKNTFWAREIQINDHEIEWNHDTGLLIIKTWGKNEFKKFAIFWHTYCRYCQLGFSSKIKVPQLGSA